MPVDYSYLRTPEYRLNQLDLLESALDEINTTITIQPQPTGQILLISTGVTMALNFEDLPLVREVIATVLKNMRANSDERLLEKLKEFESRQAFLPLLPGFPLSLVLYQNGMARVYHRGAGAEEFTDANIRKSVIKSALVAIAADREELKQ